jgi:hypothetical protein
VATNCPYCQSQACGFRRVSESDFEGFCLKCGNTWPEPGKAIPSGDREHRSHDNLSPETQ